MEGKQYLQRYPLDQRPGVGLLQGCDCNAHFKLNNMATQKPPKSIRFPDDVQEAIEKKAKKRQRPFQWIVIDGMRKQLIKPKKETK
jgi:hypothetical protein